MTGKSQPENKHISSITQVSPSTRALSWRIRNEVRKAILYHKKAGNSIAIWENGTIVIIPADQIDLQEDTSET